MKPLSRTTRSVAILSSLAQQLSFGVFCVGMLSSQWAVGQQLMNRGDSPVEKLSHASFHRQLSSRTPGTEEQCSYGADNVPMQPDVSKGRCQPFIRAVDCADNCGNHQTWRDLHAYDFQPLGQSQFQGPIRVPVTKAYRIRRGDSLVFTFARSREAPTDTYVLSVGDELQITSTSDPDLKIGDLLQGRGAAIQSDGTLWLNQIGKVTAAGLTIEQLRKNLEIKFKEFLNEPAIDILPVKTNSRVEDILEAIDARQGLTGGRTQTVTVLEDGTVRLLKLGAVCVQGLTLDDVKRELNLRYQHSAPGIYVEPNIASLAPHFIFIYGQVTRPDRYQLNGPTTVTQALSLAGGTNIRGNVREIVIFRRAEDWRYIATRVDLKGMHLGKVPTPADEIEVADSDLIIVPLTPIGRFNDFVDQVFSQGVYKIFPLAQVGSGLNAAAFRTQ